MRNRSGGIRAEGPGTQLYLLIVMQRAEGPARGSCLQTSGSASVCLEAAELIEKWEEAAHLEHAAPPTPRALVDKAPPAPPERSSLVVRPSRALRGCFFFLISYLMSRLITRGLASAAPSSRRGLLIPARTFVYTGGGAGPGERATLRFLPRRVKAALRHGAGLSTPGGPAGGGRVSSRCCI